MRTHGKKFKASPGANAIVGMNPVAKINLIRKFQRMEGNLDCCASAYSRVCEQFGCLWRNECQVLELK